MGGMHSLYDTPEQWIGRQVTYNGINRPELAGRKGKIVSFSRNDHNITYGVAFPGHPKIEFGSEWAWKLVELSEADQTAALDALLTEAAGGKLQVAKQEIKRLEERLEELRMFVKVHESL